MSLGRTVALLADVHGEHELLRRALEWCRIEQVETIALLGDLFDRLDQADRCASLLAEWPVIGVYGNHERELALALVGDRVPLHPTTVELLASLRERLEVDDVCFTHDVTDVAWLFGAHAAGPFEWDGLARQSGRARMTFAGHTHYRQARDDRGPLDLSRRMIELDRRRRYLINPGALVAGQFAIWHRASGQVHFYDVDRTPHFWVPGRG
jgi:predicted phosphodiesterase